MSAKTRTSLTNADRRLICELQRSNRDLSQDKLTALAAEKLSKPGLKRSSVAGIVKEASKWLSITETAANKVNNRAPQHAQLEQALFTWFGQMRAKGANILDSLVAEKARDLAGKLGIADFKASSGWLCKFKQRHGIKLQHSHGESGAADQAGIDLARSKVKEVISERNFDLDDVFNMDEAGLYYRAKPSKTLAVGES